MGSDYVGDTKTLDVHIKRLRSHVEAGLVGAHHHHHRSGASATASRSPPDVTGPARRRSSRRGLGPLTLRNRFIKAATFEGASPRGAVTDALVDFHRRVGAGGAAMTTVAYLAVSPEGRTDRHCVVVGDDALPGLRRLTDAVHATGAAVAAQLGHAGPWPTPGRTARPPWPRHVT